MKSVIKSRKGKWYYGTKVTLLDVVCILFFVVSAAYIGLSVIANI